MDWSFLLGLLNNITLLLALGFLYPEMVYRTNHAC